MIANFKKTLAELGHVEGQNVTYVYDGSLQDLADVEPAVRRLRDAKVDLVFAFATPPARAAQKAFADTDIPIVFLLSSNPVQDKLVASLGQPGGNITGVSLYGSEGKRLEWLHQLDPKVKRVYFPYNPQTGSSLSVLAAMQAVAPKLDIELVEQQLVSPAEVDQALKTIPKDIDAITLAYEYISFAPELSRIARERRIPLSSPGLFGVKETGALMSFGPDLVAAGGQSARLVHKILTGTKPADIPVETADSCLKLNLQTAQAIGLTIPLCFIGALLGSQSYRLQQQSALEFERQVTQRAAVQVSSFITNVGDQLSLSIQTSDILHASQSEQQILLSEVVLEAGTFDELALLDRTGREVVRVGRSTVFSADDLIQRYVPCNSP